MRVIGIDPGLRCLGWGVVDAHAGRLSHVANGTCQSSGADLAQRLLSIYRALGDVLDHHQPDVAAIEQTFVNRDGAASLKLGQARGVALLAPAERELPVAEYAPNTIKKTVVGVGHAEKQQVAHMVRVQLPGIEISGADSADALAVAICHAHHGGASGGLAAAIARARA